jgi:hypothetical protein
MLCGRGKSCPRPHEIRLVYGQPGPMNATRTSADAAKAMAKTLLRILAVPPSLVVGLETAQA